VRKLTVDDISDLRAYEREREATRARVIALKRRRRVALGDLMTLVFENTETARWQVQEMVRVERMLRDEQVAREVEAYNTFIPDANELSGTLFVELTDEVALREWLPKLVGVQRAVGFDLADGSRVPGIAQHEDRLTRADTTSAVHFLRFRFSPEQVDAFRAAPARIAVEHPSYRCETVLTAEQHSELVGDLQADPRGGGRAPA